jgi:hypothetical protein
MHIHKLFFALIATGASAMLAQPVQPVATALAPASDGFESPTLSDLWETSVFVPGAVTIQSDVVRAGHSAVRVDLHPRDKFAAGKDGDPDNERDEVKEAARLISNEDTPYEYSWSMYLPANFPIVPIRLVVAQWKQVCIRRRPPDDSVDPSHPLAPGRFPCDNDSPVLAVRYMDGVLRITRSIGDTKITLWEQKRDLRGKWLDLRVQARFTPQPTGHVRVWLDDVQVLDYTGVTANPESLFTGYLSPSHYYFKFGLYRDVMPEPMTAYFDEYRKRRLTDAELPAAGKQ